MSPFNFIKNYRTLGLWGGVLVVCRVLIGGLFVVAGWNKLQDPTLFAFQVRGFEVVGDPLAAWVAMGLPPLEIMAGAALILGLFDRGAWLLISGMTAVFMVVAAMAIARGIDVSCGCFGGEGGGAWEVIGRNIFILGGLAAVGYQEFFGRGQRADGATV